MNRRYWDDIELQYLREAAEHASWQEIAHQLGRSTKSVSDRARKLGLFRRSPSSTLTTEQVAELFGVTTYRVQQWRKRGWIRAHRAGYSRRTIVQFLKQRWQDLDLSHARADLIVALILGVQ